MVRKSFLRFVVILTLGIAADVAADRIDARQANQADRIAQGEASGELTKKEAKRLKKRQKHVENLEAAVEEDGKVTKREKVRVEAAQDRNSAAIARKKHNRRKGGA